MQRAYLSRLMEHISEDRDVLHLVADSGTGYDEMLKVNFPDQMINFGIAEEHMVAAAAGLASAGKKPFVYTAGAFLAYRALEFIRDDICFQNLNVKVVGMGSGLAWSSLGPTHHTTEDIAVLRAMPKLTILSPATPNEAAACVDYAYEQTGPLYLRLGMSAEREFFAEGVKLSESGQSVLMEGKDVLLISTGSILEEGMEAATLLTEKGISTGVLNVARIKPFDEKQLLSVMQEYPMVVTLEEHSIYGGLGSIVSEIMADFGITKRFLRIGLMDTFAKGYSKSQAMVRKENGLDAESIVTRITENYRAERL